MFYVCMYVRVCVRAELRMGTNRRVLALVYFTLGEFEVFLILLIMVQYRHMREKCFI